MADVIPITARKTISIQTRAEFIESMLALGRPVNVPMSLLDTLAEARTIAWREAINIAEGAAGEFGFEPTERDMLPIVGSIEPFILAEMSASLAVVVSIDLILSQLDAMKTRKPGFYGCPTCDDVGAVFGDLDAAS